MHQPIDNDGLIPISFDLMTIEEQDKLAMEILGMIQRCEDVELLKEWLEGVKEWDAEGFHESEGVTD